MVQSQKTQKIVLIDPHKTLRLVLELQFRLAHIETIVYTSYHSALNGLAHISQPYPHTIVVSLEPLPDAYNIIAAIESILPIAKLVVLMPKNDEVSSIIHRNTNATVLQKPFRMDTLKKIVGISS